MDGERRDPTRADRRHLLPRDGGRRETDRRPQWKIACPRCGQYASKVVDSRPSADGGIFRRRECLACQQRYNTEETLQPHAHKMGVDQEKHNM
jgi:hypothetical protein